MVKMTAKDKTDKAKKIRWNKNKKKNWRKRIDLNDVEDRLDKSRLELRTGGLAKDKADHELFLIEKKSADTGFVLGRKTRKDKRMTVDKIIVPNPDDIVPASRRNFAKRRRRQQRLSLITKLKKNPGKKDNVVNSGVPDSYQMDIWNHQPHKLKCNLFGKNEVIVHTETVTGEGQVKRPKHLYSKPETTAKAVEVAHAGASYNPTFEDHQNLLLNEYNRELTKKRDTERIERSVMVDAATIATAESKEIELKEGLFDENDTGISSDEEPSESDQPTPELAKPLTKRQRKLLAKQQVEKSKKNAEWAEKLRENEVYRIKTFVSEIQEKEKQILLKKKRKMEKQKHPTLSSVKYIEPDHDLQLSSEIRGSLRQLKPEGNLLVDRYKSLQKRCIIEPRQRFKPPKRKYKVKFQEKRTFREIEI